MLCDCQSRENRIKAVETIIQIRENIKEAALQAESAPKKRGRKPKVQVVRSFHKPKSLNWSAESYVDLLDWSSIQNLEPPLTMDCSAEELSEQIDDFTALGIPSIPCHTQAQSLTITLLKQIASARQSQKLHMCVSYLIFLKMGVFQALDTTWYNQETYIVKGCNSKNNFLAHNILNIG